MREALRWFTRRGIGGMEFSKFHDSEEIGRWDLADAFEQNVGEENGMSFGDSPFLLIQASR